MEFENEIDFIAKHYKKDRFALGPALKKIKNTKKNWWYSSKPIAASFLIVVLGASAAVFIGNILKTDKTEENQTIPVEVISSEMISRIIDFEDTPLPDVVKKINQVYEVEVIDLPVDAENYRLSLHYEGDAIELVATINEILGTEMKIK